MDFLIPNHIGFVIDYEYAFNNHMRGDIVQKNCKNIYP